MYVRGEGCRGAPPHASVGWDDRIFEPVLGSLLLVIPIFIFVFDSCILYSVLLLNYSTSYTYICFCIQALVFWYLSFILIIVFGSLYLFFSFGKRR